MEKNTTFTQGKILQPLILFALPVLFAPQISSIMNAPAEAFDKTVSYVRICGCGMLVIVAYSLIGCIFRGLGDAINTEIQDIGELATVEYLYTDAGKFEDPKQLFGKNVPFTTKSFIAKWDGNIKAGVEISEVTAEVDKDNKVIVIHMPKARILSHQIDKDSIETLDQKDGLFNPVKVEDVRNFDSISQDAMEERAIENGILDKAFENAKNIIRKIVDNDLVEELGYTIRFETIE